MAPIVLATSLPAEYGFVLLSATTTFIVTQWHAIRVGSFRKAAGVPYPNAYASAEQIATATPEKKQALYLFNCAQRSHGNLLENLHIFLPAMLLAGLKYPLPVAIAGGFWNVFRVLYAVGYTRKDKTNGSGRIVGGALASLLQLVLMGVVGKLGYDVIKA
ncbi:membrane-associated proteins in eicosanoid and glutathione metabolism [Trichodelitschia bisporula]|uniref:Membrane-associated proteins in eicosanoid and glutathione metabolism n=1 Tax=Trichodelitschia bisporula TaxID=703511 RepID=A0A6G1HXN6_9PEZI|nr:membrane-associated proteins in eicosanoid and glutathione metabolism [Trichodelitschia bisporula]